MPEPQDDNRGGAGWSLLLRALARLPTGALSRLTGRLADLPLPPPMRAPLLGAFARAAGIDVHEADQPLHAYPTFDAFFVRRLRPGARAWPRDRADIGSPADGIIGQFGTIDDGRLLQAKGRAYTAAALLDDAGAARFDGGDFLTIYLSPRHYHRVHMPVDGTVRRVRHIPGALLPVNRPAVESVDELFARNERVVIWTECKDAGLLAVVAVGAVNVGRITLAFDDRLVSNRRSDEARTVSYAPGPVLRRGDELLAFHLGSTIIVLFEPGRIRFRTGLASMTEVRLGEPVARLR